jgi:VCBS repeat-containing protein
VLANDTDIDPVGGLTVQSFTQPTFGRVTLNADGSFSYRADPDFYNTTLTFATVVDSTLGLPNNVFLVHDEQVAKAGDYIVAPPRSLTSNSITTLGRLPDGDFIVRISNGDDFERVVNVIGAGNAPDFVVTIPANSAAILNIGNVASGVSYSATGFTGTATVNNTELTLSPPAETFTYTVSDGQGGEATATVNVTVTPTNDAPVARPDSRNLNEDVSGVSGNVLRPIVATSGDRNDTDKDGDALAVTGVVAGAAGTPPSGGVGTTIVGSLGTLVLLADGRYTYTPGAGAQALNIGQTASDVFTYAVSDGQGGSASTTLTMRISGFNDAPVIDLDGNDSSGAAGSGYRGSHLAAGPVPIVDSDLRVADIDSPLLQRATITLTNARPGDVLSVGTLPAGITASLVGNVLTLSGAASQASYALALQAIGFDSTAASPPAGDRTVTVSVSDGNLSSNIATSTITVIGQNATPANTLPGAVTTLEDSGIAVGGALTDTGQVMMQVAGSGTLTRTSTPISPPVDGVLGETSGDDAIHGGTGSDFLSGGAGNDIIVGGAGWDRLTGGSGTDTFDWNLADRGVAAGRAASPASDTTPQFNGIGGNVSRAQDVITDFDARPAASGGDVLDLRDLLVGETSATLDRFLDFNVMAGATPSTEIRISSTGGFNGGKDNSAVEDQRIVLEGVDIRASLNLASNASDTLILQTLIERGKLLVDA